MEIEARPFRIRQQNINKSLIGQSDLLQTLKRNKYDLCLIQEPYIDFKGKSRANLYWTAIYPTNHKTHPDNTRSLILVNTELAANSWKQIPFDSPDITAIEIQGHFGMLRIINIYNDVNNNNALTHLSNYMRDPLCQKTHKHPLNTLWIGDFNCHHPIWDEPRNNHLFTQHNLDLTQPLLNMLG
jgi:Endonuclease-reverse transcriptase